MLKARKIFVGCVVLPLSFGLHNTPASIVPGWSLTTVIYYFFIDVHFDLNLTFSYQ